MAFVMNLFAAAMLKDNGAARLLVFFSQQIFVGAH